MIATMRFTPGELQARYWTGRPWELEADLA
jgi:hypothetical protein